MDFSFTREEQAFRQEVRDFLEKELPEDWFGMEAEYGSSTPQEWEFHKRLALKFGAKGWLALDWPKEYGGQARSRIERLTFMEEVYYHRAPGVDLWGVSMVAPTVMAFGTEEQKQKHLEPIAKGKAFWCQGLSEPESGSDLASLELQAVEEGDEYVLNGTKIWTTNAHHSDWIALVARTDNEAPKHRGISFFLVDMKSHGLKVQPITSMSGVNSFNQLFFDNVRVPAENLVGEKNRGWYVVMAMVDFERSGIDWIASAHRTLDDIIQYAKEMTRNGTSIASNPVVRHKLAEMAIEIEVGRMMAYHVNWMQEQGQTPNAEASMSKLFGAELTQRLASVCMELLGLYGQLDRESPWVPLFGRVKHLYLKSVAATLRRGTSEIQRNIIAGRGLGLPRG